jgi:uncharacterized delta-60 repeat protein
MKPQPLRLRFAALFATTLTAGSVLVAQAAPGEVDLTFAPSVGHDPGFYFVTTVGSQLFAYSSTNVHRILPDGQVDPQWQPQGPFDAPVYQFGGFPAGDWFALTISDGFYYGSSDGSFRRLRATPSGFGNAFPQADGTLIRAREQPERIRQDGSADPGYGATISWTPASFRNESGALTIGRAQLVSGMDSQGRLILGGNFIKVGRQHTRMGLVRLLADGRVDPQWNPGAAAGMALLDDGFLNARPDAVSTGPDDSILVALNLAAAPGPGQPSRRLVWINASGEVTGSFPMWGNLTTPNVPVIQPDGRVILWGGSALTNWNGTPVNGLIRINRDGSLDPTWNVNLSNAVDGYVGLTGLTLDHAGGAVIAGNFTHVNGIARPGLARVFAYEPPPSAPVASTVLQQSRVTTNEVLRLTAAVAGFPLPNLQWLRNGQPIPGATNRGLALPVAGAESVGEFSLLASNHLGVHTLVFPHVDLAPRSPAPGLLDDGFGTLLPEMGKVRQLLALPDGKLLVAGGGFSSNDTDSLLLARLARDGSLDGGFGQGGMVRGNGFVENVRLLPGGGLLVTGLLTKLGGVAVSGLAELDSDGAIRPRAFPALDTHRATAALKLLDGRYVVAGQFNRVGTVNAFRMARLKADLTVDSAFATTLEYWQAVADLALDLQGRLLIAGSGVALDGGGSVTNPAPIGVRRLLENGAFDPAFASDPRTAFRLWVEPDGTILAGLTARRINDSGEVVNFFETQRESLLPLSSGALTDHRTVRLPDGRMIGDLSRGVFNEPEVARWTADGRRDFGFSVPLPYDRIAGIRTSVEAAEAMPDGSVILAIQTSGPAGGMPKRLVRVLPDSDQQFTPVNLSGGMLRATVRTQAGRRYTVHQRATLSESAPAPLAELTGDGYWQEVNVPAHSNSTFLELRVE